MSVKNPRRIGKHIPAILEYLAEIGCQNVKVEKNNHVKISWDWSNRRLFVSCSGTPTDYHHVVSQVKRDIRRIMK